jgi:hypothetical protein
MPLDKIGGKEAYGRVIKIKKLDLLQQISRNS